MCFNKFDHLGYGFSREDGQQVRDQHKLVRLSILRSVRLEPAQGNAFAIVGPTPAPVYKGRVEPMHIVMLIVYEKTFAHSGVAVSQSLNVEPIIRLQ
jgi:hypothetical protein